MVVLQELLFPKIIRRFIEGEIRSTETPSLVDQSNQMAAE
ncbi:Uncharacterized protein APZ42_029736 [Daphnia magna]|uniref:Uncharacterized protein n=1 Tax=Daphnia magna TaxID=35525 RepID=A0A164PCU5_9CRUS|nr:Uncharacterized protein APZ42_029736 [Daphnia magna]